MLTNYTNCKEFSVIQFNIQTSPFRYSRINEFPSPSIVYEMKPTAESKKPISEHESSLANNKAMTLDDPTVDILSSFAMRAVEDSILSSHPEQAYLLTPSTSSRIKSMMIAFSPSCVSNAVLKQNKLSHAGYDYTV